MPLLIWQLAERQRSSAMMKGGFIIWSTLSLCLYVYVYLCVGYRGGLGSKCQWPCTSHKVSIQLYEWFDLYQ